MKELKCDYRWPINSGIGRFGVEICEQLDLPFEQVRSRFKPTSVSGILSSLIVHPGLFYSPGYMAIPTPAKQLLTLFDLILARDQEQKSPSKKMYFDTVLPVLLNRGNVRLATGTSAMAQEISQYYGISLDGIVVIPPGISDKFQMKDRVAPGRKLLYVGNLRPHKNFELIRSLAKLLSNEWTLNLVVPNSFSQINLETEAKVYCHRNVNDDALSKLYQTSDALLLPSLHEGFGLPVMEAVISGTPIVHLGLEIVRKISGPFGFISADPNSPIDFLSAINEAIATNLDHERGYALRISEEYSWSKSADMLAGFLREM